MNKKDLLEKLIVDKLAEPFYLNVAIFPDGGVVPFWYKEYVGSSKRNEATTLRRRFYNERLDGKRGAWKEKDLKTVKVTLYKK